MNKQIKDRIGIRYSYLVVKEFTNTEWNGYTFISLWLCKCDCGRETIVRGCDLQSGNTKSCGCFHREILSKRKGKNHPNYTNGKYCGQRKTKAILELKEKIRKRDNYTCQECKMSQEECKKTYNRILDVHHIDGDNTNNIEENMTSLCKHCHLKKIKVGL